MIRFIVIIAIIFYSCSHDFLEEDQGISSSFFSRVNETDACYYWSNGVRIPLRVDSSSFLIAVIDSNALNINQVRYVINNNRGNLDSKVNLSTNQMLYESTCYRDYFYRTRSGKKLGLTNEILVELYSIDDVDKLYKIVDLYDLEIVRQLTGMQNWYVLRVKAVSKCKSLEIANLIYETGLFKEVFPDMLFSAYKETIDTYYGEQWGLKNLEYPGIDINYEDAVKVQYSDLSEIVVAVIDDGVDTSHYDLNIYDKTYDAHTNTFGVQLSPGTHGTMVAGIIGGIANNYIGIAGVASNVKILPISLRFAQDYKPYGEVWSSASSYAEAVNYAVINGADIINCSFAADTTAPVVIQAFRKALSNGRDGKGCVIVFGAGNSNSEISSIFSIQIPEAITVGGINQQGIKSSFSNYGEYLDVVAPADAIYSTAVGNKYTYASGTSMATPFVSGIAALILSKNSELGYADVISAIESTCVKLGAYSFNNVEGRPYKWNEMVGYGLVDAFAALNSASYPPPPPLPHDTLNIEGVSITTPKVYGSDVINCKQVLVYPSGVIILSAEDEIVINPSFEVLPNGSFELHTY